MFSACFLTSDTYIYIYTFAPLELKCHKELKHTYFCAAAIYFPIFIHSDVFCILFCSMDFRVFFFLLPFAMRRNCGSNAKQHVGDKTHSRHQPTNPTSITASIYLVVLLKCGAVLYSLVWAARGFTAYSERTRKYSLYLQ